MHIRNTVQQSPAGVYPNGDGPQPSMRQRRGQKPNSAAYTSPIYDQQGPQLAPTDHHPVQSSQQPPTQQPSPPQSFKDPSPTHIDQPSDDKTPEPADPALRFSNPETPAPPRPHSQLYASWQPVKSYGQDPPPSRGSVRSMPQQPDFQSSGNFGSNPSQQPPENPPINTSSSIPVSLSPNPRAVPRSPKYVNAPPNRTQKPIYAKPHIPKEEVCLECAMRDQDMADVDVTSPGAWERDSDIYYSDLIRSEVEAISNGIPLPEDRPRSTGDILTETNLKLWLTMVRMFPISTSCRNLIIAIHSPESTGTGLAAHESGDICQSPEAAPRSRDPCPRSSYARVEATGEQDARQLPATAPLCLRGRRF